MQFTLVGWSQFGFQGDQGYVSGYKFHIIRESVSSNLHGREACSVTVPTDIVSRIGEPQIGGVYNCTYDQRGRIIGYKLLQAPGQQKMSDS